MCKEEAPVFASSLKDYIFLLKMLMFLNLLLPVQAYLSVMKCFDDP